MILGILFIIAGLVLAFHQSTAFNLFGMIAGYATAFAGVIIFVDRFMWWLWS